MKIKCLLFLIIAFTLFSCKKDFVVTDYGAVADGKTINTVFIQQAIDECSKSGGGTVFFPKGTYITGGLHLKDSVTLFLEDGTVLQGSDKCEDYGDCKWTDALIHAEGVKNIKIIGKATLDGVDCINPKGEEGFRGPHCIRMVDCDGIEIRGITIVRSANWAQNFRYCTNGVEEDVTVKGGHDAFHTRWCKNFTVRNCDFRTGDDCFAGNDNENFVIEKCKANSSCNAFRFGCQDLVIRDCHIWGPGEYKHRVSGRSNTISAFTHFSPPGENPINKNGNWRVENLTVEGVDNLFIYNFEYGLWQTGQPATNFIFENLKATNIIKSFTILGDSLRQFDLTVKNSLISENKNTNVKSARIGGKDTPMPAFFNAKNFGKIQLENVIIETNGKTSPLMANDGNEISMKKVQFLSGGENEETVFERIEKLKRE